MRIKGDPEGFRTMPLISCSTTRPGGIIRFRVLPRLIALLACIFLTPHCLAQEGEGRLEVSEYIKVRSAELYVEIRGTNRAAPLMLWLHGGPGGPERPLFRYFNGALERQFLVAYLDQRGAGRSFDRAADPVRLTIAQHLEDLNSVVNHLRRVYAKDKIYLVGHSWGTVLGLLYAKAHPETVAALISVAPIVSSADHQRREYQFNLKEATRRGDINALARLRNLGAPPYASSDKLLAIEQITTNYGGVDFQSHNRTAILMHGVLLGLVTPWEISRFIEGNNVSLRAMHLELSGLDLRKEVTEIDVPIFFFLGRYDRHVDADLAASYFEALQAPQKALLWFERSAHNVPFDEPELFNERVVHSIQSIELRRPLCDLPQ